LKRSRDLVILLAHEHEAAMIRAAEALTICNAVGQQDACLRFARVHATIHGLSVTENNRVGRHFTERARFSANDVAIVVKATEDLASAMSRSTVSAPWLH